MSQPGNAPPVDVLSRDVLVVASISGGRDSAAASLELRRRGVAHQRVNIDPGFECDFVLDDGTIVSHYEFLRGPLTDALGPIEEIRGDLGFMDLVEKKGLFPSRVMRFCTVELKVKPAQNYMLELAEATGKEIVNVVGIRRAESKAREAALEWEWSDSFDCWIWRPIVNWSRDDVDAIHREYDCPQHPLYSLGATRVGCWPCIHARKAEIALVAKLDPSRIDAIDAKETRLDTRARDVDAIKGREFVHRSMFSYGGGGRKHVPMPIRNAVDWARSGRGEWQPPGAGDGCARHGMCSADPEDDAS